MLGFTILGLVCHCKLECPRNPICGGFPDTWMASMGPVRIGHVQLRSCWAAAAAPARAAAAPARAAAAPAPAPAPARAAAAAAVMPVE